MMDVIGTMLVVILLVVAIVYLLKLAKEFHGACNEEDKLLKEKGGE